MAPAPRPDSLSGATVLLFDNGKLDPAFGWEFPVVFEELETALRDAAGAGSVLRRQEYLLSATAERLTEIADEIQRLGVDAVVLALLDVGVAQPTVALAVELELRGIPTSGLCHGPGAQVAAGLAAWRLEAVPLQTMEVSRTADRETMRAEARRVVPLVLDDLTGDRESIRKRFDSGRQALVPAVAGGVLELEADGDATASFTRLMLDSGLGDGFPLICPTVGRVAALLAEAGIDPDLQVWPPVAPRPGPLTAREVGVIAVMCGARPEWLPFVLAAFRAMAAPEFRLPLAAISGNPSGTLVLISGREALRRGVAARDGCLGPGHPANAAIGRAVALSYSVALGARLGGSSLSVQASPSKYAFCCAENLDESPWPGLHADLADADATTVTVLRCDGPRTVLDNLSRTPEGLLGTFAAALTSIASNNAYVPHAQIAVFMNPEHAAIVAGAGWSKRDAQLFLFEHARNDPAQLTGRGYIGDRPPWMAGLPAIPAVERPEDIVIAVVGAPGNLSQVSLPWGFNRGATQRVDF